LLALEMLVLSSAQEKETVFVFPALLVERFR